ncbi:MAG: hypothetical protein RL344_442 [Pseudomonadota bacterium]|jgi:uncharacterized membrane protein YecN with MAPEG domain
MINYHLIITPLYASILSIIFVGLSIQVIRLRRRLKISLGTDEYSLDKNFKQETDGHQLILRAVRVHANFSEYVPLVILLMLCSEMSGASVWLLHSIGILLLVGRISHAYGVSRLNEIFKYRVLGMAMTFTSILVAAFFLIINYFRVM